MTLLRHFSELDIREVEMMANRAIEACIKYANEIHMSGLSGQPTHNLYNAIGDVITAEWENARRFMAEKRGE